MVEPLTIILGNESEIFNQVRDYLKTLITQATEAKQPTRIYFSGEFDSNQTKFERMSNNLEIGVIANDEQVAMVLLRFVRIVVDNHEDLFVWDLGDFKSYVEKPETIENIVAYLSERETTYSHSFELDQVPTVTLRGWDRTVGGITKYIINKQIHEIDLWTFPRVMLAMEDYF
jgi:hypothetical protein